MKKKTFPVLLFVAFAIIFLLFSWMVIEEWNKEKRFVWISGILPSFSKNDIGLFTRNSRGFLFTPSTMSPRKKDKISFPLEKMPIVSPQKVLILQDDNFLFIGNERDLSIECYDLKTGTKRWGIPSQKGEWDLFLQIKQTPLHLFVFRRLYAPQSSKIEPWLEVFSKATGKRKWRIPTKGFLKAPLFHKTFFVSSNSKEMLLFSTETGQFKWLPIVGEPFLWKKKIFGFLWHSKGGAQLHELSLRKGIWLPAFLGKEIVYHREINPLNGFSFHQKRFVFLDSSQDKIQILFVSTPQQTTQLTLELPKTWKVLQPFSFWSKHDTAYSSSGPYPFPHWFFFAKNEKQMQIVQINLSKRQMVWKSQPISKPDTQILFSASFRSKEFLYLPFSRKKVEGLLVLDLKRGTKNWLSFSIQCKERLPLSVSSPLFFDGSSFAFHTSACYGFWDWKKKTGHIHPLHSKVWSQLQPVE